MDTSLDRINSVIGVTGSLVCRADGTLVAKAMPEHLDDNCLQLAARVVSQTFFALESTGQRISDVDLVFGQGRLILRNLHGAVLLVLCTRSINVALLNLTLNVVAKEIAATMKPPKPAKKELPLADLPPQPETVIAATLPTAPPPASVERQPAEEAPPSAIPKPPVPITPAPPVVEQVLPTPLFVELDQEVDRLHELAKKMEIALYALDPVAFWDRCPQSRALLAPPKKRYLSFLGTQGVSIRSLFNFAGYQPNERFNDQVGYRRLNFYDSSRDLLADVFLDGFEMWQSINLSELFDFSRLTFAEIHQEKYPPETYLALVRLQLVEMTEEALKDLSALFLEHVLSMGPEKGSIDALHIAKLCSDDWPWYRTVTMNLDRLVVFVQAHLSPPDQSVVVERVRRLKQTVEIEPKNLRWRTRALRGEAVKWYETPQVALPPGSRGAGDLG